MRSIVLLGIIVLGLVPVTTLVGAAGSAQTFGAAAILPTSNGFGEPNIAVAPDGTLYVAAPGSHTAAWRSVNGGTSWSRVADTRGASGDSDIAVDGDGTVYASDLFNSVPVSVSRDNASSWSLISPTLSGSIDRQWLAASGHGNVWSTVRDGSTERVAISHDSGSTWTTRTVATGVTYQGNILATSDNDLWIPYTSGTELRLARSHDAGNTWLTKRAGNILGSSVLFPAVAVDAAGVVYIAYAERGSNVQDTSAVKVTRSLDGGDTWPFNPTIISESGVYNLFPWLVADAAGHVEASWLEGVTVGGTAPVNSNAAPLTQWYVKTAYTSDGRNWTSQRATPTPVHTGPVCTMGTGCVPVGNPVAGNRQILDFFEMAEKPDGNVAIVYAHDTATVLGTTRLEVVTQTGGPNLKTP